jgi:hypothetical protein
MPIKSVCLEYGNGVQAGSCGNDDNFYKNHMGAGACNNSDFGRSTDACTEAYFSFNTTYTCERNVGPNWTYDCSGVTDTGCCVFVPRVQVLDNWGWCNGDCRGKGAGCYGGECDLMGGDPHWAAFDGKVIVVPK